MKNPSRLAAEFVAKGKSGSCPVIDTHGHFGTFAGIYFPNVTAEAMIAGMDRCGVRKIVCSSHAALVDPDRGNREMAAVVRKYPDRFGAYCAVNPNYPDQLKAHIKAMPRRKEFVGIKFLSGYHQYPLTGDQYTPALEYADAHGLPLLMHTWGGDRYNNPDQVAELAEKYTRVKLIMGHSAYGQWEDACRTAKLYPNVYLELCAAYHVRGVIEMMTETAGSRKILFGSDLPWFDQHYGIGCVLFSRITDEDRHNILHRNAERIFGTT